MHQNSAKEHILADASRKPENSGGMRAYITLMEGFLRLTLSYQQSFHVLY